ncbi:MAG: DUF1015 family protein [Candidatus Limnocylindria bacterium]
MADVVPFHGLRYDEGVAGPLGDLVAPPYDVISEEARGRLYQRSPYNAVRLEHGRDEPGDDPTGNRYTRAKAFLEQWLEKGVLRVDHAPAFYLHDHYFDLGGERIRRRGFLGALRLYQEGRGIVRPHERTFPGPKTDRLRLLRLTRLNTSPVFGMFEDRRGEVAGALEAWMVRGPARLVGEARAGAERHLVWRLDEKALTAKLRAALKDKRIYIADGHHRYETALAYLKEERDATRIELDEDTPNYVLAFLCALDDPGLRILATHRVLRGGREALAAAVERAFDASPIDRGALGDTQPGIVLAHRGAFSELRVKETTDLSSLPEAWRVLPVAQAEELLVGPAREAGAEVSHEHDTEAAIDAAAGGASALLLRAVDTATLQRIADAWQRLPPKTTYFYPKVPAGLVFRPLGD